MDFPCGFSFPGDKDFIEASLGAPLTPSKPIIVRPHHNSTSGEMAQTRDWVQPGDVVSAGLMRGDQVYSNGVVDQRRGIHSWEMSLGSLSSTSDFQRQNGNNGDHSHFYPLTYSRRVENLEQQQIDYHHQHQANSGGLMQSRGKASTFFFPILSPHMLNNAEEQNFGVRGLPSGGNIAESGSSFPVSYSQVDGVSQRVYTRRGSGSGSGSACAMQMNYENRALRSSMFPISYLQIGVQQQQQSNLTMLMNQSLSERLHMSNSNGAQVTSERPHVSNNVVAQQISQFVNQSLSERLHEANSNVTPPISERPHVLNSMGAQQISQYDNPSHQSNRTTIDAFSSGGMLSFQSASVTPDNGKRAHSNISEMLNAGDMTRPAQEEGNQGAQKAIEVINLDGVETSPQPVEDASEVVRTSVKENLNLDKREDLDYNDLNETPRQQQKSRRKKHRPKVVIEGEAKKTPKPVTPKQFRTRENPQTKRKYVRRSVKASNTPLVDIERTFANPATGGSVKNCKRSLDFNLEGQVGDESPQVAFDHREGQNSCNVESSSARRVLNFTSDSQAQDLCNGINFSSGTKSTLLQTQAVDAVLEKSRTHRDFDLNQSLTQELSDFFSSPENPAPANPLSRRNDLLREDLDVSNGYSTESAAQNRNDSRGTKRRYCSATDMIATCSMDPIGNHFSAMPVCHELLKRNEYHKDRINLELHLPVVYKKKRTERRQKTSLPSKSLCTAVAVVHDSVRDASPLASKSEVTNHPCNWNGHSLITSPDAQMPNVSTELPTTVEVLKGSSLDEPQSSNFMLSFSQIERTTKKRSTMHTRVRDLSALIAIAEDWNQLPPTPAKTTPIPHSMQRTVVAHYPHTCIEALLAEDNYVKVTKKKRTTKGKPCQNPMPYFYPSTNEVGLYEVVVYQDDYHSPAKSRGPSEVLWPRTPIDEIILKLNRLTINGGRNTTTEQGENAIVPFGGNGALEPYEGILDLSKKRMRRARVHLDKETDRVWKLLMGKEVGEEPTDQKKEKWWEDERKVFRDRADSFIARMHLVQGDRRFSRWKGSVLDSVIGVFLTQNVSDHLSSSAFMSLAARYPITLTAKSSTCYEMGMHVIVKEPEVVVIECEDTEKLDEKEVADNNESSGSNPESNLRVEQLSATEEKRVLEDVVSSQKSVNSSAFVAERITAWSEINLGANPLISQKSSSLDGTFSFMELLYRADTAVFQNYQDCGSGNLSTNANLKSGNIQSRDREFDKRSCLERKNSPEEVLDSLNSSNSSVSLTQIPTIPPYSDSGVLEKEFLEVSGESRFSLHTMVSGITETKDGDCTSKQIGQMEEIVSETIVRRNRDLSKYSSNVIDRSGLQGKKILEEKNYASQKTSSVTTTNTLKANGKVGREKRTSFDWDCLRKEVYTKGLKREKNSNTTDSLDWEAVRCADAREIANIIKERGMNHMLADRIKVCAQNYFLLIYEENVIHISGGMNRKEKPQEDFLNRLVKDHGSMDMEWLRDVPPDKVKDYLLSIRGLGLKSVECVRLLTLHHLAFPVDTNVGRIAVRLGWVPLQPLPESLQLHLLELYPMLESIQKYLWPRLCTLDQRTLYELHYQMITFGKVFCTKKQPNCNACPLRGECRHFASAFASARLALPGPEEKGIVASDVLIKADRYPVGGTNPVQLGLPETNSSGNTHPVQLRLPVANPAGQLCLREPNRLGRTASIIEQCEPIIEEPSTPEVSDIEDMFYEDLDEIPAIDLNIEEFALNISNYMQENNMEFQEGDLSNALVSLTPREASIPTPKLKNVSRLRTEHLVYELPDSHPLLKETERREPDDPSSYLLAIWTPGETADSTQPPDRCCDSQELGNLCTETTCFACSTTRETNCQTVRGTILIPCKTAMRGSFPLNGTYFQVNEMFADHESSMNPINVPRAWIWNLPRRTVFFGTAVSSIFKGLTQEAIQSCFWRGFVCVRGFDRKTRVPKPLLPRLHFSLHRDARNKASASKAASQTPNKSNP
ncbi:hypothetical protein GIB67_023207 [Kingdonia uniflora]|uniref:HhH-GPD domain-containing protein n=1 Tax=Kingdonia uniflora TaxID=39325 RepID=A0A7J7MC91_9MAGN|nr:hypothetical protein GIB67_023207 [Kingdonia uniflora]